MSKLSSVITLTVTAVLLAGCSTAAEEPEAQPAATSESASPSASPTVEETTPEPTEAPSKEVPEPSPEPTTEPAPVPEQPKEPVPTIDPLPVGPNDPFVPPPHGEPNPMTPPVVADGTSPHVNLDYFNRVTITPVPGSNALAAPSATIQQGKTLAVVGEGYAPGQRVYVMLGWPNTDTNYILEPATAVADQNGYFVYSVVIGTNVPPRDYVVVLSPLDVGPDVREASKRYHNLVVTAG